MRHQLGRSWFVELIAQAGVLTNLVLFAAVVTSAQQTSALRFSVKPIALPGANGLVMLDYIAYDNLNRRLWVPAGNIGSVDVIDGVTDHVERVDGFTVAQVELRGKLRSVGPSSIAIGAGVIYVGNRADSKICVIDGRTLELRDCIAFAPPSAGMAAAPDGLMYIPAMRELWATSGAPPIGIPSADSSIRILSASQPTRPTPSGKISLPGSAEGYALDMHGRFYTNIEETGQTVAIDVRKRAIVSTWRSCDGPSGVAVDRKRGFVFVACRDHVIVLDPAHHGRTTGSIATGTGVDNIDYDNETGLLYAAAADAAQLTVARVGDDGKPALFAVIETVKGARSVIVGSAGSAYLIDPMGGRILKVEHQQR